MGGVDCNKPVHERDYYRVIDPRVVFLDALKNPLPGIAIGDAEVFKTLPARRFAIPAGARYFVVYFDNSTLDTLVDMQGSTYTSMMPAGPILLPVTIDTSIRGVRASTGFVRATLKR